MLTRKQRELLVFIRDRLNASGVAPSFDEMKDALDLKSKSGIHRLITGLVERGYLQRLPNRARAIEVLRLPDDLTATLKAGAAAVAGHNWPLVLRLRGGKGIATTFGFIVFAMPSVGIVLAAVWLAVIVICRYASVASMLSVASSPIAAFLAGYPREYIIVCLLLALSAVVRHVSNIRRLANGTENKFVLKLRQ